MPELRQNRIKHKLQEGKTAIVIAATDGDSIETLGATGAVDGIWIEMEHGPITWAQLSDLSRACDLWGMTSLVRVNAGEPWLIGRTLDRGIQGVIVPHVNTKETAQRVVRGAKYAPQGMRGIGGSRQGHGVSDYLGKANDELMVMVLIEEIEAVSHLSEILTVDYIDCFFVAPSDLAQTMGPQYLGRPDHPDVQAVVGKAITQVVASGRVAGTLVDDSNVERYLDLGAQLVLTNTQRYVSNGLRRFQEKVAAKVPG